jgi:hypothetical protein
MKAAPTDWELRPFIGPKAERVLVGDLLDGLQADHRIRRARGGGGRDVVTEQYLDIHRLALAKRR